MSAADTAREARLPSIAFVLPGYAEEPVGGFRVVYEYASRLSDIGYPVTVHYLVGHERAAGWRSYPFVGRLGALYTMARLRMVRARVGRGAGWFPLAPKVRESFTPSWVAARRLGDADVLVATAWNTADLVASLVARPDRVGMYLVQHYETWNGSVAQHAIDATWRLPLHKIVIARWLEAHAHELGEADRTTYIPNGLDFDVFKRSKPVVGRDGAAVSMLVSGLSWKGHRHGLEAVEIARRTHPQIRLTMFGNGVDPAELPAGDGYRFAGMLSSEQLAALFNETGIFLHTSLEEGWGLPPAEAMACGAAVIAADNAGVLDYVTDDHSARVVPRADANAMAKALVELVDHPERRERLAATGHSEILSYTWDRAVETLSTTLQRLWAPAARDHLTQSHDRNTHA